MARENAIILTIASVEDLQAREGRYCVWDSQIPGFGIRVETSGTKSFVVRYRSDGGGRLATGRYVAIGRFGKVTVEEARKKAKTILGRVALGADPAAELRSKRHELRMSALIDLYEKEGCVIQRGKRQGEPMKDRTKKLTIARLRNHVVPLLGNRRASEINAGDMERFFRDVAAGKTAKDEIVGPRVRVIVRGGEGGARKVFRDLSAVFSFALRQEIVTRNPCMTAAVRKTDGSNERFLSLDELKRLGKALEEVETEGANTKAVNIVRLWALTGCRREEIAGLKWSEVNLDEAILQLDDSKTGKSVRPLGVAAQTLLAKLHETKDNGSEYVFPAERGDNHFQGTKLHWSRAIKKAKLKDVTPHTLRHTMGSTAASNGEALSMTGAILGHANPRSTAIYAHVQRDPSKRAANRVTKKIAEALGGDLAEKSRAKSAARKTQPKTDKELLRLLARHLAVNKGDADTIRAAIAKSVGT